jgi:hypothetical protein
VSKLPKQAWWWRWRATVPSASSLFYSNDCGGVDGENPQPSHEFTFDPLVLTPMV